MLEKRWFGKSIWDHWARLETGYCLTPVRKKLLTEARKTELPTKQTNELKKKKKNVKEERGEKNDRMRNICLQ